MHRFFSLFSMFWLLAVFSLEADTGSGFDTHRSDSHAPISVMGDHVHAKGEWMISYRAMLMNMKTLTNGDDKVSDSEVKQEGYMMVPEDMDMVMHMLGGMYAQSDQVTWMLMIPYRSNTMDMRMLPMGNMGGNAMNNGMMNMPMHSSMDSSGLGDIKLGSLVLLHDSMADRVHLNLSVSLPTGSINEKNDQGGVLPYPMQLGSGSVDLHLGATWLHQWESFSFGSQLMSVLRSASNNKGYQLGNEYQWANWLAKPVGLVSLSANLKYVVKEDIEGADERLAANRSTSANPSNQGGEWLMAGVGMNVQLPKANRLAFEYQVPAYQKVNGIQLAQDQVMTFGWQMSF